MRRTEDLILGNAGQVLWLRVISGRPTAGTGPVYADTSGEDDSDTIEFTAVGSVDPASTTVDAASGPAQTDPRRLNVTATANFTVGIRYLLEENGTQHWFEPREIVLNDYMLGRYPLPRDYTVAATLKSTWLSFAIDNIWVADEDNLSDLIDVSPSWRMRCEVTNVDGNTEIHYIFFSVVRAPIDHSVVMADLALRWPGLMHQLDVDQEGDSGQGIVDAAWRSLRADFAAIGINEAAIGDLEGLDEAMVLKLRAVLASGGMSPSNFAASEFYVIAHDEWNKYFEENYKVVLKREMRPGTGGAAVEDLVIGPVWAK